MRINNKCRFNKSSSVYACLPKKTTKLLNKITPLVVKKRFKETCAGNFTLPMCSLSFAFEKFPGRKSNRYAFNLVFLWYHNTSSNYP